MDARFHYASLETLGLFTAAFLLGSGIFQIPAGMLAGRIGLVRTSFSGLLLIGLANLLFAVTGDFGFQMFLRFAAGLGTALYFAPSLTLVTDIIGRERSGIAVGLYYSVFYLCSGVSVFLFAPLAAVVDWRLPFIVTSILTFVALLQNVYFIRGLRSPSVQSLTMKNKDVFTILRSKIIWAATISILGTNLAYYLVNQFGVTYFETQLRLDSFLAGAASSCRGIRLSH